MGYWDSVKKIVLFKGIYLLQEQVIGYCQNSEVLSVVLASILLLIFISAHICCYVRTKI